jgi:hypothetical protein
MAYNYGKTFKKNGKNVRYRYTNKDKATKKLVPAKKPAVRRTKKNSKR